MSTGERNSNILFQVMTIMVAIIGMVLTYKLAENQLQQQQTHFNESITRDSLLNIEKTKLVKEELALAKLQYENAVRKFKTDSLIQSKQLSVSQNQLGLVVREKKNRDNVLKDQISNFFLFALVEIGTTINREGNTVDQNLYWLKKLDQEMKKMKLNPLVFENDKISKEWNKSGLIVYQLILFYENGEEGTTPLFRSQIKKLLESHKKLVLLFKEKYNIMEGISFDQNGNFNIKT